MRVIYKKQIMLITVVVFDIIVINIILNIKSNIKFPDCLDFYWNICLQNIAKLNLTVSFVFNIQLYFAFVEFITK